MAAARPTLREWVLGLVDRSELGLAWVDRHHLCFSVPWGRSPGACDFIQRWATVFGKDTGTEDFAKWKHGLRCALDSQFTYQSEGIDRPQRRLYNSTRPAKSKASPSSQSQASPSSQSQTSPSSQSQASPFNQLYTSPSSQSQASPFNQLHTSTVSTPTLPDPLDDLEDLTAEFAPNPHLPVQESEAVGSMFCFNGMMDSLGAAGPEPSAENRHVDFVNSVSEVTETEMFVATAAIPCTQTLQMAVTDLDFKVLYRGSEVFKAVTRTNRCIICHDPPQSSVPSPPQDTAVISLPPPVGFNEQQRLTARILEPLARMSADMGGVVLEVDRHGLYATRHALSRVYWSGPSTPRHAAPVKLPRGERVCLFNLETFMQELIQFMKGSPPRPQPSFEILLCFGQEWPNGTLAEKLIMVQVQHSLARLLVELARQGGASSLDGSTVRLQISDPLSNEMMDVDQMDDFLKWINADSGHQ
ncbi:interferon regulatory factor 5-like isoform X2 [Petromyzon marinus]|uniref:Interferon regulatory factor 6-like isoform X2 n=1 Tax=Petromyzon marinus TaxID=7757 RepID=A0AAJ7UEX9_PETMA|nr:interferon regulatory factor 6-like isoform X2 [Petromyzon marinus]